jgi:hypothetical protein
MPVNNEPERDDWSKLEIIAKLLGNVFLVALTVAITYGANKISAALHTGEFTQKLLTDLARVDSSSNLRHEIALAALNHTVWEQNPKLVWEVCARIITNTDFKTVDRTYAFKILKERDSTQALNLVRTFPSVTSPKNLPVDSLKSPQTKDTIAATPSQAGRGPDEAYHDIVENELGNIVFIQFQGDIQRSVIKRLQDELNATGYNAPGVDRVEGDYSNEIRYFHKEDAAFAIKVCEITQQFLMKTGKDSQLNCRDLSVKKFQAPKGQVEVWLRY